MLLTSEGQVIMTAASVYAQACEREKHFKRIHLALKDAVNEFPYWLPVGAPMEVRQIARLAKVNLLGLVVDTVTQALYVDGYRSATESDESAAWDLWQANQMDAHQIAVHRGALGYGESFLVVLPGVRTTPNGEDVDTPVMRAVSARKMTCWYDDPADEWPMVALECRPNGTFRLYDDVNYFTLSRGGAKGWEVLDVTPHNSGVCPVVRYRASMDLDDDIDGKPWGEVTEALMRLQDQINITTFGLQVAQHYGAFRQRYILGWVAESESQRLKASASKLWTFEDSPQDVQVGEFSQTDLAGYIDSREATIRHLAAVSQTPAHELVGQLVNLSAEALAAAEAAQRRKITERQTIMGEAHEQALQLAAAQAGLDIDPDAEVRWRDTESRALSATVDALGKMVQLLGVPPQELWDQIPNVTQQQVLRWKAAAADQDSVAKLNLLLSAQAAPAEAPAPAEEPPSGYNG